MDRTLFQTIGNAKATQGGENIRDGKGLLIINKLELGPKTNGEFFISEFVVLESQKVPVTSLVTGLPLDVEPNPPGSSCSIRIPVNNPEVKSGPGNVKAYVLALLGYTEAEVDATPGSFGTALAQLVDKDPLTGQDLPAAQCKQPARGMVIAFETYRKLKKKKSNEEMTLIRWTHVPPSGLNDPKLIAERRAKLVSRS